MRITEDDLARILLNAGPQEDEGAVRAKLFTQDGIEKNKTVKNIHANLSLMMRRVGVDNLLDLYATDRNGKIAGAEWIEGHDVSDASKARYYSSLMSAANPEKHGGIIARHVGDAVREKLREKMRRYDRRVKSRMDDNLADDRELRSILPWQDIVAGYKANRAKLGDQQGLIADLYIGFADSPEAAPRRLDYNNLRVYASKPKGKQGSKANYVVAKKDGTVSIHLAEFKTAASRAGPIEAALPPGLSASIVASLGSKPWRRYLLYRTRGSQRCEPLSAHLLGYHVRETTEALTGKKIPVNSLRKSFITWLHGKNLSVAVLKRYAYNMGHSVETAALYRRINISDSVDYEGGGGGSAGEEERGDVCFKCGQTGHWAKDCGGCEK